ncbi:MAG: orotidine-5'-phosphate decarboxylase [Pyrinomonadaceae bacterium MAG19_C2-C3]|nr:orotidine-5'-phosphate decarboxylase [Pyrinomonadaceae bacterium MAG19_C2-C3]
MTHTQISEAANDSPFTQARDKLIVALDVDSITAARETIAALGDVVSWFKIGSQLFTLAGGDIVREVTGNGARVFLDLKFHDIPNTVAGASREAVRLGASLFNVHALGGAEMMRRALDATRDAAHEFDVPLPALIAVTILTSHDGATLNELGFHDSIERQAVRLAALAHAAGLDGVVASAHEIKSIRENVTDNFLIVTPGVRPAFAARDDQRRVMTPGDAVRAGANFLVVGRAITSAPDPPRAAAMILDAMNTAMRH